MVLDADKVTEEQRRAREENAPRLDTGDALKMREIVELPSLGDEEKKAKKTLSQPTRSRSGRRNCSGGLLELNTYELARRQPFVPAVVRSIPRRVRPPCTGSVCTGSICTGSICTGKERALWAIDRSPGGSLCAQQQPTDLDHRKG